MCLGGQFLFTTCCLLQWNWRPRWAVGLLRWKLPKTTRPHREETGKPGWKLAPSLFLKDFWAIAPARQFINTFTPGCYDTSRWPASFTLSAIWLVARSWVKARRTLCPAGSLQQQLFLALLTSMYNWQSSRYGPLMCVKRLCESVKKKPTRTRSGWKVKTVCANLPEEEARFDVGLLVTSWRLNSANKLIVGSVLVFVVKTGYHQVTVPRNFPLPISIFPQNWPVKIPVATSSHIFRNGPHSCSSFMVHSLCTYSKNLNEQLSLS